MISEARVDGMSVDVVKALVVGLILCDYFLLGYCVDVVTHFLGWCSFVGWGFVVFSMVGIGLEGPN
jgi:hypothetical protein